MTKIVKSLWFLIIVIIFAMSSCSVPEQNTIEKYMVSGKTTYLNKQVYPVQNSMNGIMKSRGYVDVDPLKVQQDFEQGIFYYENSFDANGNIYTLDLSEFVGHKNVKCDFRFEVLDYGSGVDSERGEIKLNTPGSDYGYKYAWSQSMRPMLIENVMTDSNGCISWYSVTINPYDAITENASPGYHCYKWIKVKLTLVCYVELVTIN